MCGKRFGVLSRDEEIFMLIGIISPSVHPAVDDGIVHGVTHGQPVYSQVYVLRVRVVVYLLVLVAHQKVYVLWQPANTEYYHHYY